MTITLAKLGSAHSDVLMILSLKPFSNSGLKDDYNCYISLPNEVTLTSSLDWYRKTYLSFTDIGKIAKDVLAGPASTSAVEFRVGI
jgi:hypothetical protein